jgi:hypothetical protein
MKPITQNTQVPKTTPSHRNPVSVSSTSDNSQDRFASGADREQLQEWNGKVAQNEDRKELEGTRSGAEAVQTGLSVGGLVAGFAALAASAGVTAGGCLLAAGLAAALGAAIVLNDPQYKP